MRLPLFFAAPLLEWAAKQGATIDGGIDVREVADRGRGLYATAPIAAGARLVRIPGRLQLGVEALAEGDDLELQAMVRDLPWRDLLSTGLTFLPCALALLGERRAADSRFGPYLDDLPRAYSNAVAPWEGSPGEDCGHLAAYAPATADKVRARRAGLVDVHDALAPAGVALRDLCWASATVCSRALVRTAGPEVSDLVVGAVAARDRTRLLPVIDLVNHGAAAANAAVRTPGGGADPLATVLVATRDLAAGDEVLIDYRADRERLLLDYGFADASSKAAAFVGVRLKEDLLPAIGGLGRERAAMRDVPEQALDELRALIAFCVDDATRTQGGSPLLFEAASGAPTTPTLALALALSCRGPDDVANVLATAGEADGAGLGAALVARAEPAQADFAREALRAAAAAALDEPPADADAAASPFSRVARAFISAEHGTSSRAALRRVAAKDGS